MKLVKDVIYLLLGLFLMSVPLISALCIITDLRLGLIVVASMLTTFYLALFYSVMKQVKE